MKACARIHTELSVLLSDIPDNPTVEQARDIAHQLRVIAKKYDIQADDAWLTEGSNDDDNQN